MNRKRRYAWAWRASIVWVIGIALFETMVQAATISGTVYQSDGTTPITGVSVNVNVLQGDPCGASQWVAGNTTNFSNGTYTITGVPAGTYYLQTWNDGSHYYVNEWWASPSSQFSCENAQSFTVAASDTITDKNFQLDRGGAISGIVYQSDGTTRLTGVHVEVDVEQGTLCNTEWVMAAPTNSADGTYKIAGVPVGTYYLQTWNDGSHNYVEEWWAPPASQIDCQNAQTVTVTSGVTTSGKNFQLDLGGQISGTVYQSNGTTPLTGVKIRVRAHQGDPCGSFTYLERADSDPLNGTYTIHGIPAGTYYLKTDNRGLSNYVNEWWNAAGSSFLCADAQTVTVTSGGALTGKNFQLDLGGQISGTVYQSDGTTPLTGVEVRVSVQQGTPCTRMLWITNAATNSGNGTYIIYGVPAGTYYLQTSNQGQSNYVNEWWNASGSQLDCTGAQPVNAISGGVLTGKNFQLDLGGTISGAIYKSDGVTLVTDAVIRVFSMQGNPCGTWQNMNTQTTATGIYALTGVPVGVNYLFASDENQSGYVSEWWALPKSVINCSGAQTMTVTAGATTSNKNFQLDRQSYLLWTK